ncbi:MAG: DUF4412 domain-containing protein [Deltaproteobacteria bacterium]|nr:DUF4412 domain-containing protein [Deltaproteobacteria bacterium]NIS77255.1 DUF4412 domain-containing protein [Deltaproteobacteria bacterium]
MKRVGGVFLPVLALVLLLAATSGAGVMLVDRSGSRTLISGGKFKEVSEEDAQTMIFDVNSGVLTIVDRERQAYSSGTVDEFCSEASGAIGAAMEGMSEEERAMVRQFMEMAKQKKPQAPPDVRVTGTGSGGEIAGLPTTKYRVEVNGALFEEIWLTDDEAILKEFRSLSKLADMTSKMAGCTLGEAGLDVSSSPYATPQFRELFTKGYPLKMRSYGEGSVSDQEEVVEVRKEAIPDSEFDPPGGYRKISFGEMLQQER